MPSVQSLIRVASALAVMLAIAGCTAGGNFDPTEWINIDTKKKIAGDREPVFPNGVPGVANGVPSDLVKGYQPPPEPPPPVAEAAPAAAPANPAPKAKPKPKPKPQVARAPAKHDSAWDQKPISAAPRAVQPAWPAPSGGGGQQAAQPAWPAAPASGQAQQAAPPIWPSPPPATH